MKTFILTFSIFSIFSLFATEKYPVFKNDTEFRKYSLRFHTYYINEYLKTSKDSDQIKAAVKNLYYGIVKVDYSILTRQMADDRFIFTQQEQKEAQINWRILKKYKKISPFAFTILLRSGKAFKILDHYWGLKNKLREMLVSYMDSEENDFLKTYVGMAYLEEIGYYANKRDKGTEIFQKTVKSFISSSKNILNKEPGLMRSIYKFIYPHTMKFSIKEHLYFNNLLKKEKSFPLWFKKMIEAKVTYSTHNKKNSEEQNKKILDKSLKLFLEAGEAVPFYPEPFVAIAVRKLFNQDVRDNAFNLCKKAQPDSRRLYEVKYNNIYNKESKYRFAMECYNTERFDTLVPMFLHIFTVIDKNWKYLKTPKQYERLQTLYTKMAEAVGDGELYMILFHTSGGRFKRDKANFLSLKLALAIKMGRLDDIQAIMKEFSHKKLIIDTTALDEFGMNLNSAVAYCHALSGQAGGLVRDINEKINNISNSPKDLKFLKQDVEDAESLTAIEEAQPYFDYCYQKISEIQKYTRGEWVNFKFTKDFSGFDIMGHWGFIDENTLNMNVTRFRKNMYLRNAKAFKPPFELEIEVEQLKALGNQNHFKCGLLLGNYNGIMKFIRTSWSGVGPRAWNHSISFYINPKRGEAGTWGPPFTIVNPPYRHPMWTKPDKKAEKLFSKIPKTKKQKLHVKAWYGYYEFYVDGKLIGKQHDLDFTPVEIGFGTDTDSFLYYGEAKFANFKIRQLKDSKPPTP